MTNKRWTRRPEGSNWGDFGEDDQLGRLNLIDHQKVLEGVAEVKEGKTFCLSLPLDFPGSNLLSPVRFPPRLQPVIRNEEPYYNYEWRKKDPKLTDIASDDAVFLHMQYSTQWDSLAHRGSLFDVHGNEEVHPVYYNGFSAGKDVKMTGKMEVKAGSLGIEHMAAHGVQGRGVLVDLYSHYGEFPRKEVGYEDLMYIFESDNIEVEKGDILCLWTGLDSMIMKMNKRPQKILKQSCAVFDGHDNDLLNWITDSEISAIASDNLAIENVGVDISNCNNTTLPLHEHCLFKLGVHLGELWYFEKLAKWLKDNDRNRFMLTAPPLRLPGAVGSPVTPIATV